MELWVRTDDEQTLDAAREILSKYEEVRRYDDVLTYRRRNHDGKPKAIPDYFTVEEAKALVAAAPSYQVRMAMRVMLRTGLPVSECLSLRPADLRLNQAPPIIPLRPEVTGNKSKKGREVPIPDD